MVERQIQHEAAAECYIWLETTPECFISCSAQANAVLSTGLMYESRFVIMADSEKLGEKEHVIVSPSLIRFDASTYVYNPRFDLGIG